MLKSGLLLFGLLCVSAIYGQRAYKASSVLATGSWYKIAIREPGLYKVDLALLKALGINTSGINSSSIRLFGNGGNMLPESCREPVIDDLEENAIRVFDGGDGILNGEDYFLFYAGGPHEWLKDSLLHRFHHRKNLYSDRSFYFITIGGSGKRVEFSNKNLVPGNIVTSFNERFFYEPDLINFLSSGKQWYGEEFGSGQGKSLSRSFTIPLTNLINETGTVVSEFISRSIDGDSRFAATVNNVPVLQHGFEKLSNSNLDLFARTSRVSAAFTPSQQNILTYSFQQGSHGSSGWLDWFEIFTRKRLEMSGADQMAFRDWNSVSRGYVNEYIIQAATPSTCVWDITNALAPVEMKTVVTGNELRFSDDGSILREYIAFHNQGFLSPTPVGKLENQDLHASGRAELIIITNTRLQAQARRLADHHTRKDNLKVILVTAEQVYNEFASGSPDPTAIRNFVKMFYDKAGSDSASRSKYLLLFGDASYDYKDRLAKNTNFVPAYQSDESLDPLGTYTSDDYFGYLDDSENIRSDTILNFLDIGIGRIPASTPEQAGAFVDKLIGYSSAAGLGTWRNNLTFIADDEDLNLHFRDAEVLTAAASIVNPSFLQKKIYLDAYPQVSDPAGSRYPLVNQDIEKELKKGTLIWNYSGHGGFRRLAEEVILDEDIVDSWNNAGKLPLVITATCDFAPFDNPAINSLGEDILLRPHSGAIALMTTTRLVFAYSNRVMNRNYLEAALKPGADGKFLSLGDAVRTAKNSTYLSNQDISNARKFTLLGDPALTLAFPQFRIRTDTINAIAVSAIPDTLKALQHCTISGSVTDVNGVVIAGFNGTVYTTVFDKAEKISTRSNDPSSIKETFEVQDRILFKGKADVSNGKFSFGFIVPQDINYREGFGKICYYAENGEVDAHGDFTNLFIGGSGFISADKTGPEINAFLHNRTFINGTTLHERDSLYIELKDISGINIVSTGIDHDITAILDDDPTKRFVLNDFYESDRNRFQKGGLYFVIPELEVGLHTLKIRAWDVVNNSGEVSFSFRVEKRRHFSILRLYNFPNPLYSATTFRIDHDLEAAELEVDIKIFSTGGHLVKTISHTIMNRQNRSCEILWDGRNDKGAILSKGIYFYIVRISASGGAYAARAAKMVIL